MVVLRLDRMGRSLHHLARTTSMLAERGVGLKVLTGQGAQIDTATAAGRLSFGIFAALAKFESELIRERTMAELKATRARGQKGGRKFALKRIAGPHGTGCHGQSRYVGFSALQRNRGDSGQALPVYRSQWQSTQSRETSCVLALSVGSCTLRHQTRICDQTSGLKSWVTKLRWCPSGR